MEPLVAALGKMGVSAALSGAETLYRGLTQNDTVVSEKLQALKVLLHTVTVLFNSDEDTLNLPVELHEALLRIASITEVTAESDTNEVIANVFTKKDIDTISKEVQNLLVIPLLLTLHFRVKKEKGDVADSFIANMDKLKLEMIGGVTSAKDEVLTALTHLTSKVNNISSTLTTIDATLQVVQDSNTKIAGVQNQLQLADQLQRDYIANRNTALNSPYLDQKIKDMFGRYTHYNDLVNLPGPFDCDRFIIESTYRKYSFPVAVHELASFEARKVRKLS